ncbi:MAG: YkgJ family cysteine cluster protein [Campylobacterales bacterium]
MTQEGFPYAFDPTACASCGGNCCIGDSGYIWVSMAEIEAMSRYLGVELKEFISRFCVQIGARFSLKEYPFGSGYACCFFDPKMHGCSLYEVRPRQCRTFPFWDYFKRNPNEAYDECPGIIPL